MAGKEAGEETGVRDKRGEGTRGERQGGNRQVGNGIAGWGEGEIPVMLWEEQEKIIIE